MGNNFMGMVVQKMKKRLISIILVICLSLSLMVTTIGAASLSNFSAQRTYRNEFTDISSTAWYFDSVRGVYEYGIMSGNSATTFNPSGNLTIAEAIKIAANLHKGYFTGSMEFPSGSPWYAPFVDYALENGIIAGPYANYNAAATRSDFAVIIAGAMPDEAITPINRVFNGAIPDVLESYSYGHAVYRLYRAGILTGSDRAGTFHPGRTIMRRDVATIIMRILKADTRETVSLTNPLTAEQIYSLASPAVFYIEMYDADGNAIKTGSGFFISASGIAVTNYHVVIGGSSAKITMDNGEVHDVAGIYDYDWKNDIALIQINVRNVPYLETADASKLQTGETVYTLGSPLGLHATFSRGIVSQSMRDIQGVKYIQIDAPISSGSSGGALLDSAGRVVGVTSATAVGAQNINLAMPINLVEGLSRSTHVTLKSILVQTAYYEGFRPAPDFGAFFNVRVFNTESARGGTSYSYALSDIQGNINEVIDTYTHIVEQNLFVHTSYLTSDGVEYKVYYNSQYNVMLTLGRDTVRNRECFTITVS